MDKFEIYNKETNYGFYDDVLEKLCCENNDVFEKESKIDKTKFIKRVLVDLGHDKGFKVYANGFCPEDIGEISKHKCFKNGNKFVNKEWLYDLHWFSDIKNENFMPENFILACECEWAKGSKPSLNQSLEDIGYDFQKLLFSNSNERLMITRVSKTQFLNKLSNYFYKAIQNFENLIIGSKFMIVIFCIEDKEIYVLELIKK